MTIQSRIGINVDGGDSLFANMVNGGTRNFWFVPGNHSATVDMDNNGWPLGDGQVMLGEGNTAVKSGGHYLIQFNGKATVTNWPQQVTWIVDGVSQTGNTLPSGVGYNGSTNTTTATMVVPANDSAAFYVTFKDTSRDGSSTTGTGITNLYVMQPSSLGGSYPLPVGTIFMPCALKMFQYFEVLRCMNLAATNGNLTSDWADRTVPSYAFWCGRTFNSGSGVNTNVQASTPPLAGPPWEIQIALANKISKDLYINIPSNASVDYINNLANLFVYGSDGVNPYSSPQSNPVWAPLDSTLKVYIEFSNELWNSGFVQAFSRGNGWMCQLSQRAIYDFLTNNQNDPLYPGGGANAYNDGAIMAPYYGINSGNDSDFLNTYNASPPPSNYGDSPAYFNNSASFNGYSFGQGLVGLRLVQISNAFKKAFGETKIKAIDDNSRVRPLFEWQYGGSWSDAINFINSTFGPTNPVNYYLYGAGGGWYADQQVPGFSEVSFTNPSFADDVNGWTPSGDAGVVSNGDAKGNPNAPPLFAAILVTNGATQSGNDVTISTTTPHGFTAGQSVNIQGVADGRYNGDYTVATVPTPTSLTYSLTATGLPASGCGMVTGANNVGKVAYLSPGSSLSQNVTFNGGFADITLFSVQSVPYDYYNGLTITLTPVDGGPVINGGRPIAQSEGPGGYAAQGAFLWSRTAAFYTGGLQHTYKVTFASTLPSGTVFFSGVAIQTVNGMFNEAAVNPVSITGNIQSDVKLSLRHGLRSVGYEGGFDFDQNLGSYQSQNGYHDMGYRGFSSAVPNVGMYANLDRRTKSLALNAFQEYFNAGGNLAIIFESSGNVNSWAVAAPTYYDFSTPKFQEMACCQWADHPPTYGLQPGQWGTYGLWWLAPGSEINNVFLVSSRTYVAKMNFGQNWPAPATETSAIQILVNGKVVGHADVPSQTGGTFIVPVGFLNSGQYSIVLRNAAPSGNANLAVGSPGTQIYTILPATS